MQPRRWRGLDLGTTPVYLQATTRRVSCPTHGVVVAAVPWARRGRGSPARSRTPPPGWSATPPSRWWRCCCGSRGARYRRSSSGSSPSGRGRPTDWSGCAGSGSTRSATARGSGTCWS
ncbi:MAG: transposase family protein [Pseudonocardia sp.]